MLLRQTIHKSKSLARKTIRNLKLFFFGGYQKLPKSLSFRSFSCGSRKLKSCKTDQIYSDLYEEWEAQLDEISKRESKSAIAEHPQMKEEQEQEEGIKSPLKIAISNEKTMAAKKKKSRQGKGKDEGQGGQVLARKMKDLEMVDSGDMEQALDIEEAIHYYSRLKSPVYLDIVDKFFVDMYSELSVPQNASSAKINNSKRRRGSFRL